MLPSARPECFLSSKKVSKGKSKNKFREIIDTPYPSIHSPALRSVEHSGRAGWGLFIFIRFFVAMFIFSYPSLSAKRWPVIIIADGKKTFLGSLKRSVVSQNSIKDLRARESANHVFPEFLSYEKVMREQIFSGENLEDVFESAAKKSSTKIHVLLTHVQNEARVIEWHFASPQGFILQLYDKNGVIKKAVQVAHVVITIKQGVALWKGKRIEGKLRLRSIGGYGECNGVAYDGDFCIMPHKDKILCINQVCLEDYITAVLHTESWPGWPLEVNKVFAIACRSYVAFKLLEARRSGRPFHVKNTNAHQTYRGKHNVSLLKTAVEQTKGIVLGFAGKPALAMFDSCCGGVVPAHIADFDFTKVPYLARIYACTHCKQSSLYAWNVSYDLAMFEALLQQCHDSARLSDIHIIKKDKAGLVMEVGLKGPHKVTTISGKKLYSLLKDIKSFYFNVSKKAGTIIFTGRGFGHHLGLCQWGARQMVRDGWDYKSILRFYYPGTYFMHLIE
jgi:stage II sporulation protein D